ncbi:methylamine utilization protein MauJ [Paraburkholderia nodosa]|uniref:methylamine utilization protein MauJ n=1 Tax=Paraburkholderia nodosa TaxID=392320 RepID=UPI0004833077|nr:methylamine utilization protein MauJ [Paraburkholderia nodosa]
MAGPYVPHYVGDAVDKKLRSRLGWLTAGVATSIPWPPSDVWVTYDGDDYILRGSKRNEQPSPPGITIACDRGNVDDALAKVYRFTSILGWYRGGFVDVSGYTYGSHPVLYGDPRNVYSSIGTMNAKNFNCNHMPIVHDELARKALAFYREGSRLRHVHDNYSFLSFHKVIESQFANGRAKGQWINANLDNLTDERAVARIAELRASGLDVGDHLFESGRCAVAHASLNGEIVDPDIPADRRRLSSDLCIMEALARYYIGNELHIENDSETYAKRNRLAPWRELIDAATLAQLQAGEVPQTVDQLDGHHVSIGLWPDGPIPGLEAMTMRVDAVGAGAIRVVLVNERATIGLPFVLDFRHGRVHTQLEEGGLYQSPQIQPNEADVRAYATYFYNVLGNGRAELVIAGLEPVDCEIVIPVNIIPQDPNQAIEEQVERFRQQGAA